MAPACTASASPALWRSGPCRIVVLSVSLRPEPASARDGGSLTARLAFALALIFGLGGLGIALAAFAYGREAAQRSYDRLLTGAANQIARSITLRDGAVTLELPVSAFELLSLAPEDRVVYAVYDASGALVTGYDSLRPVRGDAAFFDATFTGEPIRVARVQRLFAERGYTGGVEVLVGQTLRARNDLAAQITRNALIAAGVAGLIMCALAVFAVRMALNPVSRIEAALRARTPQDLSPLEVAAPREVASLVEAVNRFMARLDRQMDGMRTLIADASHQLRTPIAAVRAQAELAAEETDPDRLRAIAERIYTRSVTLSRLTEQLLNHALIIHRADAAPLELLDLRTVVIRAVDEVDQAAFAEPARLRLDVPEEPVCCEGDALSLVEAVKNLIGNALRHGVEPVSVLTASDAREACIAVRDAGAGIPEALWADASTRYARDAGVSPTSAGLGLAIVRAVALAHKGRLAFRRLEPCGFEVAIFVPLARDKREP